MRLQSYWWILIWILLFGVISSVFDVKQREIVLGQLVFRWKWFYVVVLGLPYVVWAGLRSDIFGDTTLYRATFRNMPIGLSNMISFVKSRPKGPGFSILEYLFKTFISRSDIAFFFFIALLQLYFVFRVYRKYSRDFWLSVFFFVASTDYILWMYNGIRQFVAASFIFTCIPLVARKKHFGMCLIVILAALIHSTALIYIPFIFVVNGRAWNKRTLLFIAGLVTAILFVNQVSGFMIQAMEGTAYEGDISIFVNDDGTNIIRVLFYAVPTVMAWMYRSFIDRAEDPIINLCVNLSIISTGIYVFSIFTSGVLVGAVPIYFSLGNYILIPWLLTEVYDPATRKIITAVFIAVYCFFFYYQCGVTWNIL